VAADAGRVLVVAPNETEAASMLGERSGGEFDVADLAARLAASLGDRPVAVRGVDTVVVDGAGGRWDHRSAPDGLGTAGSGDVFAGAALALLGRGVEPVAALGWAVALHARAGELATARVAAVGFLAREVAAELPRALMELQSTAP
jgi:NAD(P)H-hydrate repair Nnr-like enzyme with NAD(P)H-hydrate dehydratase domain